MSVSSMFVAGDRVRFVQHVERFPFFVVKAGTEGTVVESNDDTLGVRPDNFIVGCEDWDNVVYWYTGVTLEADHPERDLEKIA